MSENAQGDPTEGPSTGLGRNAVNLEESEEAMKQSESTVHLANNDGGKNKISPKRRRGGREAQEKDTSPKKRKQSSRKTASVLFWSLLSAHGNLQD